MYYNLLRETVMGIRLLQNETTPNVSNNLEKKERIFFFDCSRFICILWIVLFWHGKSYISDFSLDLSSDFLNDMTYGALCTFVFLSGFFNGKKQIESITDLRDFYKRRFIKLYIPYFISLSMMLIMHYIWDVGYVLDLKQYLLSLFGLSLIIRPAPSTIWFVGLLILYYVITPIIIWTKHNRLLTSFCVYLLLIVFREIMELQGVIIDSRIILYFPFYSIGLCYGEEISKKIHGFATLSALAYIIIAEHLGLRNGIYEYLLDFSFIIMILQIGKILSNALPTKILSLLGVLSMDLYLFHRQFYFSMTKLIKTPNTLEFYVLFTPIFFIMLLSVHYIKNKTSDVFGRIGK